MPIMKIRSFLVALILFGMTMTIASARAQSDREESSADVTAPVERPRQTSMKASSSPNCSHITSSETPHCSATPSKGPTK